MIRRTCRRTPALLERRRGGRLEGHLELRLSRHLSRCAACRQEESLTEPLSLFAGLGRGPLPAGTAESILGAVRAEQTSEPAGTGRARWIAWLEPAPAVVSLGVAAGLVILWAFGTAAPPPAIPPRMEVPLPAHAMTNAVATVEDIRSSTARVFAFSVGGATGPTEVILIVDGSIDL